MDIGRLFPGRRVTLMKLRNCGTRATEAIAPTHPSVSEKMDDPQKPRSL
jgi:hypothetical protein